MFNAYPYGQMNYGSTYTAYARPQARNTQPLTPDQIAKLRQDGNAFDMKIEQEDLWRSACTHKEKNGNSTLVENQDGTFTCTICHETFKMCDNTKEEIEAAVNTLINMLQTSKTVYLDAPDALVTQYYQIIPLLKKFPDLWERAMKNFAMYDMTPGVQGMAPGYSGFAAMQTLLSNPYSGYGQPMYGQQPYMAQPMYGQPTPQQAPVQQPVAPAPGMMPPYGGYAQPVYGQAPVMDPNNPMAYGAPTIPAPTAAPAPGVMPQAAPAPAAAPAPQQAEVQQQQVFNV